MQEEEAEKEQRPEPEKPDIHEFEPRVKVNANLPDALLRCAQDGVQWFLLEVAVGLDWKASLEGATLQIRPDLSIKAPKCPKKLALRRSEDVGQFIPLLPADPGKSNRLVPHHSWEGVYRIFELTTARKELNSTAAKAAEEEAAADRKRQVMQARARGELARRRVETRERCGIPPLQNVLEGFGLPLEKFSRVLAEDEWSGQGPDPLNEGDGAAGSSNPRQEDCSITLKADSGQRGKGQILPLVFWRLANSLSKAGQESLEMRLFQGRNSQNHCLMCTCQDAPEFILTGKLMKRPGRSSSVKKHISEYRYLLGAKVRSNPKTIVFEADCFFVEPLGQFMFHQPNEPDPQWAQWKPPEEDPEEAEGRKSYWEQRNLATNTFGIAKRQRDVAKASEKAKKRKFLELDQYASALSERAEALEANLVDTEERSENNRRKYLPPYNGDALEPYMIYQDGLETICPGRHMQAEAQAGMLDEEMVSFLREVARKPDRIAEYNNITSKSKLLTTVISTRAKTARETLNQDTENLALRLEVLYRLVLFYKSGNKHQGRYKAKVVANLTELSSESALAKHWWNEYCTEIPGNQMRSFNGRKVLCALLVWALYLTPGQSMVMNMGEIEEELRSRGELKKTLENIGCTVTQAESDPGKTSQPNSSMVKLAHPPRLDMDKYEAQNLLSSKRGGKGRGRGRGR